jgi:hypothetical protein
MPVGGWCQCGKGGWVVDCVEDWVSYFMKIADLLRAWRHHEELDIREAADRIGINRRGTVPVNQATILQVLCSALR